MAVGRSIEYEGGANSLFARWERGEATRPPAPLATRSRWYRRVIGTLVQRLVPSRDGRILSFGSGNGFAEAELLRKGYEVLATDISQEALGHCARKGLSVRMIDLVAPAPSEIGVFDLTYADGLLGHLLIDPSMVAPVWSHIADLTKAGGYCLVSNDLADSDLVADLGVAADPTALFLRPPAGWFQAQASSTSLWTPVWSRALLYHRPGRGLRRRELLVLQKAY